MSAFEKRDNYKIMFERTRALFLKYDQEKMIERFQLDADERYLYLTFVARPYRIERATGAMEYWKDERASAECVATESAADENPRAECVATECAADERASAECVATESTADKNPRAERVATESAADKNPRAERVATESAADENPRAERVAIESAAGVWLPAGHGDGMTIYDILCDSKPDARVSGRFQNAWNQRNVSSAPNGSLFQSSADFFSGKCALLSAACERLGGERVSTGDVGFDIPVFNEIKMRMLFWDADDEFPASMNLQWDEHILDFMRYETTFYAAGFILNRLREEAENERGVAKAD